RGQRGGRLRGEEGAPLSEQGAFCIPPFNSYVDFPMKQKSKRRPFGTSAGNAFLLRKRADKAAAGGGRHTQREPSPTREEGGQRNATESKQRDGRGKTAARPNGHPRKKKSAALRDIDPNNMAAAARRRDSKTPKANNLSAAPGAYGLGSGLEFDSQKPRAKAKAGAKNGAADTSRQQPGRKPDPSPVKLPDPSAANAKATRRASKSSKRGDKFVAASLKRLFSGAKGDPRGASPPGRRRDGGGSSDMDTACSTPPERDSPLITSPQGKPDPVAKDEGKAAVGGRKGKKDGGAKASKRPVGGGDTHPNAVSKAALERARDGPLDDQRVLNAMLNGGARRPRAPTGKDTSVASLVGSIVGGTSLQRSYSADESVLTTLEGVEDASQASMTTRAEHAKAARGVTSRSKGADVFRSRAHAASSKAAATDREIRRANTISSVPAIQPSSVQLPAGWKVKWSKTKQRPYYVHPDFGSTWHCPGLVSNVVQLAGEHELYDDQRVPLGMSRQAFLSSQLSKGVHSAHSTENASDASESAQSMSHRVQSSYRTESRGGGSTSGFDTSVHEERFAREAGNKDVASTDASSTRLFSQDFGSDDCVASADGHVYSDPVEFDGQGGGFDDEDAESLGQFDDERLDPSLGGAEERVDEAGTAAGGGSVLNSLASDHVDVDALLRQGANRANKSPMGTIKERCPESAGVQSSVVSDDDGDDGDLAGLKVLDADKSERSLETSGSVSYGGGIAASPNKDLGSVGRDQSPMFDNTDGGGLSDFDDGSVGASSEKSEAKSRRKSDGSRVGLNLNAQFKKEAKALRPKKPKKKIFPPGPLCSLQFLEEIEHDEFDTPLWRRMKRKRSTLTSVKREKANQRQRRRGTHS
ncbi:hypothetical protein ACHAXT_001502, partial [Thalassiosira profunda]